MVAHPASTPLFENVGNWDLAAIPVPEFFVFFWGIYSRARGSVLPSNVLVSWAKKKLVSGMVPESNQNSPLR
jgi:hypothetical protein